MLPPALSKADLHLLYVFSVVVEAKGFSQAQSILNVAASTISRQMLDLETRLGMKLCDRGRKGFRLTEHGATVFAATQTLFASLDQFRAQIEGTRGELTGNLSIAVVDNWIFSDNIPIFDALRKFTEVAPKALLEMYSLAPDDIERAVQDERVDIGIGVFHIHKPGLVYEKFGVEHVGLYCRSDHPLANAEDPDEVEALIKKAQFAHRTYLREAMVVPRFAQLMSNARAHQVEGIAILILTGKYIGFLPANLANIWVQRGKLRNVANGLYDTPSDMEIVIRRGSGHRPTIETCLRLMRASAEQLEY